MIFSNLAPADFEDLVRDLVGRELCMCFEAFGPGPDGGIDGRHAKSSSVTTLQAKRYTGSTRDRLLCRLPQDVATAPHRFDEIVPLTGSGKFLSQLTNENVDDLWLRLVQTAVDIV